MLISNKYKFIFFHNYKVAGTSITNALLPYGVHGDVVSIWGILQNEDYVQKFCENDPFMVYLLNFMIKCIPEKLGKKYLRAFIVNRIKKNNSYSIGVHIRPRNLLKYISRDMLDSFYKFGFVRNPWDWQVSLYHYMLRTPAHPQYSLIKSMESFDEYIKWRVFQDKHLQKDFFFDKDGNQLVDFIGKFENLNEDFNMVCKQLGISATLPHARKSLRSKNYHDYYNSETRKLIEDHFKEDIQFFGYQY